tara:strand:+ start:104 stop:694 length:591 start_codon:yes stop_codon:yes gene_type:complete
MDNPFIVAWVASGVIASFIFIAKTRDEDSDTTLDEDTELGGGNGCLIVFGGLLGFISLGLVIVFLILEQREKAQWKKEEELAEKKSKERAQARAKSQKKKKESVLKNHSDRIEKLIELKTAYENESKTLTDSFFKDSATLASDLTLIPKKDIKKKDQAIELVRFARVNIFNMYSESKAKESEKLADKLTKALKKIG